jgi:hypothetical protein
MTPTGDSEGETLRLREEFDLLPKTPHGLSAAVRHSEVRPEWIMWIIKNPHDGWVEIEPESGEVRTILVGRVPQFGQWIRLVFIGSVEEGEFHTAYPDKQLEKKYGGRPWRNQS